MLNFQNTASPYDMIGDRKIVLHQKQSARKKETQSPQNAYVLASSHV